MLIASILNDQDLNYLGKIASNLGLSILVEVHNAEEMKRILSLGGFPLIGINNRDLSTFKTDIATTEVLIRQYEKDLIDQVLLAIPSLSINKRRQIIENIKQKGIPILQVPSI